MVSHPETGSDSPIGSDRDRGRDIEPNPRPIARTTTSTDHVCGLGVLQGQNRA